MAVRALLRLCPCVRDQDAAVPVPQLAARRLQRGADTDADHVRGRYGQGRRLRLSADRRATVPAAGQLVGLAVGPPRARCGRDHLGRVDGARPERHEDARLVLEHQPYGLYRPRHLALNVQGQQGALLQMVNHGIIIAALFLIVGWITEKTGVRDRSAVAGLALRMPVMAGVFAIVTFAALGLPGLNSFVGEFMTLLGAWQRAPVLAVLGAVGLVLAPVYMLRLFQGVTQGAPSGPVPRSEIYASQLGVLAPLIVLMFVLGLDPALLTNLMTSLGQTGLAH